MPAPALRDVQRAFWRHVADAPDDAPGRAVAPALAAVIAGDARLGAGERLDVYARMYFWRLLDVLREDHPRTVAVLGEDAFRAAVRGYLARHPSTHPSVRHVGERFADDLGAEAAPGAPPWLADLARLEWARRDVFDAPDAPPLRLDALRAHPAEAWPALRFAAVPALAVVVAGWPVQRAWPDDAPAELLPPARTALRVWRGEGWRVYHAVMDAREEAALARLVAGTTFAELCEVFADLPSEQAASQAAGLLVGWIEDGLILEETWTHS